jgi:Tfp pilus assembly protein PilF
VRAIRTFISLPAVAVYALVATVACGCASSVPEYRSGGAYETVAHDPRRDTATARRENDEAVAAIDKGRWADGEASLKRALAADVTFGPAHSNLGSVYEHRSNHYLAAWEFQYAATLMPEAAEPRNNLGLVFESVGRLDDAVQWYDRAVALRPDVAEYAGNDARARLKRGDRDPRVRELLQTVILRDVRPAWIQWARGCLATFLSASTKPRS